MKKYFLAVFISLFAYGVQAQSAEAPLKQEAPNFIEAYANILQHRDKDKVLKYVSMDLKSMVLSTDIRDKVRMVHNNYARFDNFLDKLIQVFVLSF
mgnify:FL=1